MKIKLSNFSSGNYCRQGSVYFIIRDRTFYTTTEFADNFNRLNAVLKEFEVKDHIVRPFLNIKMIDLNRQTVPLYKRLEEKNKTI